MADWKFYGRREQLADFERMLNRKRWTKQYVGIPPLLDEEQGAILSRHDIIPQDRNDLTLELHG